MHSADDYYSGKWLVDGPPRLSDTPRPLHVNRPWHFHARWMKDYNGWGGGGVGKWAYNLGRQVETFCSCCRQEKKKKSPGNLGLLSWRETPSHRLLSLPLFSPHSTNWPILMSAKCHFIIKASPRRRNAHTALSSQHAAMHPVHLAGVTSIRDVQTAGGSSRHTATNIRHS